MKYRRLFILPLLLIFLSGCSAISALLSDRSQTDVEQDNDSQVYAVVDMTSLIDVLQAEGASVETGDSVDQPFFDVQGQILTVNNSDIQVFEFSDNSSAEVVVTTISPDGDSVGTSMMMWMEPPHFYQVGRLIVLYLGSDEEMLTVLNAVLGEQIAGQ